MEEDRGKVIPNCRTGHWNILEADHYQLVHNNRVEVEVVVALRDAGEQFLNCHYYCVVQLVGKPLVRPVYRRKCFVWRRPLEKGPATKILPRKLILLV